MQVTTWLVLQWRLCFLSLCERARIKMASFVCVILKMKLTLQSPTLQLKCISFFFFLSHSYPYSFLMAHLLGKTLFKS